MDSLKRALAAQENSSVASSTVDSLDRERRAFINGWKVEPQADDRIPMFGAVARSNASPSVRRSVARRRHQTMYKEWSRDRHD